MTDEKSDVDWAVFVTDKEGYCETVFRVGVQFFRLAYVEKPDEEAEHHCQFVKRCFLSALERMGVDISQAKEK